MTEVSLPARVALSCLAVAACAVLAAQVSLVAAAAVAVALTALLSALASRPLRAAEREIVAAAERLAAGDLSARVRLDAPGRHLAAIQRAFNALAIEQGTRLEQLSAETRLLGAILDGMGEGVLVVDAARRIALANPAARNLLFLPPKPEGATALELLHDAELHEALTRAMAGTPVTVELEIGIGRDHDGGRRQRFFFVHAAPLAAGGAVAVLTDVTELRRLEGVRRDFVANVSHELRTPVAAIRAAAETLAGGALADPRAGPQFVDIIVRHAGRLGRLIEDLLDLSKIESRQVALTLAPVDARELLEAGLAAAKERLAAAALTVALDVAEGTGAVLADRAATERVLVNLLENAAKYTPAGGQVTLFAQPEGNRVRLGVKDTGVGIEQHHLPRLFERFYRVDGARTREQGGTGLGLAIVKHLVQAQGGGLDVQSTPGRGSTFSFTLPAA